MRPSDTTRIVSVAYVAAAVLAGMLCWPVHAAVYHCTSATGETLFTDSGCPPGYTTALIVPDPPAPDVPVEQRRAADATGGESGKGQAADAELARLKAEAENARLRSELDQERLRAIDRKLDALLDTAPVYGAVGVVPLGVIPKPLPVCRGRKGQTPRVNCRPGRNKLDVKVVPNDGPSCGVVGCTPGIDRRLDRDATRLTR
jgi:hypothetical protein